MATTDTSPGDYRLSLLVLCGCVVCCLFLGYRVCRLRAGLSAAKKAALSANIASASQTLDNLSLPQNKAFVLCNHSESDVEVRTFSVAYWDSAGKLRTMNAINNGWISTTLHRGEIKNIQLQGWPGNYAMYAVDFLRQSSARTITGTSDSTAGPCIAIN
jgi:hypothetical protein